MTKDFDGQIQQVQTSVLRWHVLERIERHRYHCQPAATAASDICDTNAIVMMALCGGGSVRRGRLAGIAAAAAVGVGD